MSVFPPPPPKKNKTSIFPKMLQNAHKSQKNLNCSLSCSKCSKWLHAGLRNIGRERFCQKVDLFTTKLPKMVKMVKMELFSIFYPQIDIFLQFLIFRPWGGRLRKRVKNLVEFEDFWDPKSLKTHFGPIFTKNHHFWCFGARRRQNLTFESKMRKMAKFPFFAFWWSGRTHTHTHTLTHRQRTESSVAPPFSRLWNEARGRGSPPPLQFSLS